MSREPLSCADQKAQLNGSLDTPCIYTGHCNDSTYTVYPHWEVTARGASWSEPRNDSHGTVADKFTTWYGWYHSAVGPKTLFRGHLVHMTSETTGWSDETIYASTRVLYLPCGQSHTDSHIFSMICIRDHSTVIIEILDYSGPIYYGPSLPWASNMSLHTLPLSLYILSSIRPSPFYLIVFSLSQLNPYSATLYISPSLSHSSRLILPLSRPRSLPPALSLPPPLSLSLYISMYIK